MNGSGGKFIVRRIVVAADSSSHGHAALEAAVRLAARLRAQLQGVFVEDIDLVNLSQLPVGRELHPISGQAREFDVAALETDLHREAGQARRMLEVTATAARVDHSFRVVRGRVEVEVIAAAGDADLLVLGIASRPGGLWRRAGAVALATARGSPRSVLLLGAGTRVPDRALVAYDGGDGADLALDAALRVARDPQNGISVMLVAADDAQYEALRQQVLSRIEGRGVTPGFVRADALDPGTMCRLSRETDSDILIIGADTPSLADDGARQLIEGITCPILMVR